MADNENVVEPQAQPQDDTKTEGDFDLESNSNLTQIRDYAKGLKQDLETYKTSHQFVEDSFGTIDNAKLAHQLFDNFVSDEFNPDEFTKTVTQLSPKRGEELISSITEGKVDERVSKQIQDLFGRENVAKEDIQEYVEWRNKNVLGGDELPESLKFNPDGTPRSDEEIKFFNDLRERTLRVEKQSQAEAETKELEAQQTREQNLQIQIGEFGQKRMSVLDKEFTALGLDHSDEDTQESRQEKDIIKAFVVNGIGGMILQNPEMSEPYNQAVKAIKNGEPLLAKRYETVIEQNLLNLFRSDGIMSLFTNRAQKGLPPKSPRPEISNTGGGAPEKNEGEFNFKERLQQLISSGKIGKD